MKVCEKMSEEIEVFLKYFFKDFFTSANDPSNMMHKFILSAIIIFIWIGILKVSKFVLLNMVENVKYSTPIYKVFRAIVNTIAIIVLFGVWMKLQKSALLILVVLATVIALSIKNLFTNLVAWLMLVRNKYFKLYDRIEINDIKGDVVKITPFYFKVIERENSLSSSSATGRVVHIPNHILLDNTLYNYGEIIEFNWGEVKYHITVDSDWKLALAIVKREGNEYVEEFSAAYQQEELERVEKKLSLFEEELKLKTYVMIDEEKITIIAQYPIHYTEAAATKSMLNERIISHLNEADNTELSGKAVHIHFENEMA